MSPRDRFDASEIEEFREIFDIFDADDGGTLQKPELRRVLSTLGKNPCDSELDRLITEIDVDGSGEIDFDEFLLLLVYLEEDGGGYSEDQLREYFDAFDVDAKGYISLDDLRRLFRRLSAAGGVFLADLEKDPDASVKDRAIPWDDYYNRSLMRFAQKKKIGKEEGGAIDNLSGGGGAGAEAVEEPKINFDEFIDLVGTLEM